MRVCQSERARELPMRKVFPAPNSHPHLSGFDHFWMCVCVSVLIGPPRNAMFGIKLIRNRHNILSRPPGGEHAAATVVAGERKYRFHPRRALREPPWQISGHRCVDLLLEASSKSLATAINIGKAQAGRQGDEGFSVFGRCLGWQQSSVFAKAPKTMRQQ